MRLIEVLDPDEEPGRLTLICRFGADKIDAALPPLLRTVKREGRKLLWVSDPMHGNTIKTSSGYKTRPTERIAQEVRNFFAAMQRRGRLRRRNSPRDDRQERHRVHRRGARHFGSGSA